MDAQPVPWNDIHAETGDILGMWSKQNKWISVRSLSGATRTVRAGPDNEGLARLMLNQPWASA